MNSSVRSTRRVFLVTPLRDEMHNIPRLMQSIEQQDHAIACWLIVQNGSTDGSAEFLSTAPPPKTVRSFKVITATTEDSGYALGAKYAQLIDLGFRAIRNDYHLEDDDLIGILDADSFPEPNYYSLLADNFDRDASLGITSGLSYDDTTERPSGHAPSWVRGSCRLWRGACLKQCGYMIAPSADSLASARAELSGWRVAVTPGAKFYARAVGSRAKQRYYGASAHFRGHTLAYAFLRSLKLLFSGRGIEAWGYFQGYTKSMRSGAVRIDDADLRRYFRTYLWRNVLKRFRR